jgi:hypothetical protein
MIGNYTMFFSMYLLFNVIFSSFQDQLMQKYLEDYSYLLKKQELENHQKRAKMKKYADTIIPRCKASSHDANRLI